VLSYNDGNGTPNWVSWRVSRSDLGDAPRKPQFDPDDTLPAGFKKIAHRDYSGGGFDRGHLCPHADRAATQEMAWSTFVMTNIIPQAPNVNQKAWEHLESYCRGLARRGQHLYIMAGPIGKGGTGSSGLKQTIANGKVTVPAECWKIVVVVPEGGSSDDLGKINSDTRVIAVVMPNDNNRVGDDWAGFRTSVSQIEAKTGYHFFERLRPEVAATLKQKVDTATIAPGSEGGGT
jgi:endonuclease G